MTNIKNKDADVLAIKLRNRLIALLQGNNISENEISLEDYQSSRCQLNYSVDWEFSCSQSQNGYAGNHHVSPHYGDDVNNYNIESTRRCTIAKSDKSIRGEFISSIAKQDGDGLFNSISSNTFYNFGGHSVHTGCNNCKQSGAVYCGACGGSGNQNCYSCAGRGKIYNSQSQREDLCYGCMGTGKMWCSGCGGKGWIHCNTCDGAGFFTWITTSEAIATPKIYFSFEVNFSKIELNNFLSITPVNQLSNIVSFSVGDCQDIGDSVWRVYYKAFTTIIEAGFKIKNNSFRVAAIGDSLTPFIKPHIFDYLFSVEIEKSKTLNAMRKVDYKISLEIFNLFKESRLLSGVVKSFLSKYPSNSKESIRYLRDAVFESCEGFISKESSSVLGLSIPKFIKCISPEYSKEAWNIYFLPVLILLFVVGAYSGLYGGGRVVLINGFSSSIIIPVLATLIAAPFAAAASSRRIAKIHAMTPKEFQVKSRHYRPIMLYMVLSVLMVYVGGYIGAVLK